jgi:hypothetical protein
MRNEIQGDEGVIQIHEAVDPRVPNEILEEYVLDARSRWTTVNVEANQE